MERLNIPHIPYTLMWDNGAPYSVCEDFIDETTELIPAWRILQTKKKSNNTSVYTHFKECCEALGIKSVVKFIELMIFLDYIIANEDRHLNNFGAIRNAETLEWMGMAPIYDSGSSLGYDKIPAKIRSGKDIVCKPFKNHHSEQLKLVSDFGWIDFENLSDMGEVIKEVLSSDGAEEYIDESRINAITDGVEKRIETLRQLALLERPVQADTAEDDVAEDIAEDYTMNML